MASSMHCYDTWIIKNYIWGSFIYCPEMLLLGTGVTADANGICFNINLLNFIFRIAFTYKPHDIDENGQHRHG